jgi:chemotaxis protein MotB
MARKRKSMVEDETRGDEWLATYADTITLLLTFFILLYSFSKVDNEKLVEVSKALNGILTGQYITEIEGSLNNGNAPIFSEQVEDRGGEPGQQITEGNMYEEAQKFIKNNNLSETVAIREPARGIILQIQDAILFDTGKADIRQESKAVLNEVYQLMSSMNNNIIVEGHTDNVPIRSKDFDSNWELSTSRSVNVVRYFTEEKGMDPHKFAATGYGEYKPLVDNSTPENKAQNRRVDILIVTKKEEREK